MRRSGAPDDLQVPEKGNLLGTRTVVVHMARFIPFEEDADNGFTASETLYGSLFDAAVQLECGLWVDREALGQRRR